MHIRRQRRSATRGFIPPHARELRNEHGVVFVVAEVTVIGGARVVVEGDEITLGIQCPPRILIACAGPFVSSREPGLGTRQSRSAARGNQDP